MSNRAITWAYSVKTGSGPKKAVLVVLADAADEKNSCYPKVSTIAGMTELNERTIRRALKELEASGFISITKRRYEDSGKQYSSRYVVNVPDSVSKPGDRESEGGDGQSVGRGDRESLEEPPAYEPPTEPTPIRAEDDLLFAKFWDSYPRRGGRRVGKKQAHKVWLKMRSDQRERAIHAVKNYAAECNGFPKDAHRWLRDECYDEYLTPAEGEDRPPELDGYARL